METITIRELVLVGALGASVVTLVRLKMREKLMSSKSSPKKEQPKVTQPDALETVNLEYEDPKAQEQAEKELEALEAELLSDEPLDPNYWDEPKTTEAERTDKETRNADDSLGTVPSRDDSGSTEDGRRPNKVSVSKKLRSRKATKTDGPASPKRSRRKSADR